MMFAFRITSDFHVSWKKKLHNIGYHQRKTNDEIIKQLLSANIIVD